MSARDSAKDAFLFPFLRGCSCCRVAVVVVVAVAGVAAVATVAGCCRRCVCIFVSSSSFFVCKNSSRGEGNDDGKAPPFLAFFGFGSGCTTTAALAPAPAPALPLPPATRFACCCSTRLNTINLRAISMRRPVISFCASCSNMSVRVASIAADSDMMNDDAQVVDDDDVGGGVGTKVCVRAVECASTSGRCEARKPEVFAFRFLETTQSLNEVFWFF